MVVMIVTAPAEACSGEGAQYVSYAFKTQAADIQIENVPKPETLGLFVLGLAGLAAVRKRSKS
jgi:hypothetical protein